jgi:glucokinase
VLSRELVVYFREKSLVMTSDVLKRYAIVADIGGTFARFSRVNLENFVMDKIEIYSCAAYESLESVLLAYKAQYQLEEVKQVALAIACPVFEDVISMTNAHWYFSISELKHRIPNALTLLQKRLSLDS